MNGWKSLLFQGNADNDRTTYLEHLGATEKLTGME